MLAERVMTLTGQASPLSFLGRGELTRHLVPLPFRAATRPANSVRSCSSAAPARSASLRARTSAVTSEPSEWAWVGFVLYTDRLGTDDLGDRFMTLLQIGAALVIAAATQATADRAPAFAIAYGAFREARARIARCGASQASRGHANAR